MSVEFESAKRILELTEEANIITGKGDETLSAALHSLVDGYGRYEEGFEAGKKSEHDAFWDVYQNNDGTVFGNYMFYNTRWGDINYKPKYDMKCSSALSMYYGSNISDTLVSLDCSGIAMNTTFAYCGKLHTIRKLIVSEDTTYSRVFELSSNIANLMIEGCIAKNGFSVQWSEKLSHDSLMSIINCLQDKSNDTSGTTWTVTIGGTNRAKLTDEELSIAATKGWEVQ